MKSFYYVATAQGKTLTRHETEADAREAAAVHPFASLPAGVRVTDQWGATLAEIRPAPLTNRKGR